MVTSAELILYPDGAAGSPDSFAGVVFIDSDLNQQNRLRFFFFFSRKMAIDQRFLKICVYYLIRYTMV